MKSLGYGATYQYPHNFEGNFTPEEYLPEKLRRSRFYRPSENGFEEQLSRRLEDIRQQLEKRQPTSEGKRKSKD